MLACVFACVLVFALVHVIRGTALVHLICAVASYPLTRLAGLLHRWQASYDPYPCCARCHNEMDGSFYLTSIGPQCPPCQSGTPRPIKKRDPPVVPPAPTPPAPTPPSPTPVAPAGGSGSGGGGGGDKPVSPVVPTPTPVKPTPVKPSPVDPDEGGSGSVGGKGMLGTMMKNWTYLVLFNAGIASVRWSSLNPLITCSLNHVRSSTPLPSLLNLTPSLPLILAFQFRAYIRSCTCPHLPLSTLPRV